MASDGSIKISIEIDGKEIEVASKSLDKLEESGNKSGKGIKAAESSVDSLADSSAKASKDVKGAADSVDGLADSGSKASKDLKSADSAIDGVADSSTQATSGVKGVSGSLEDMSGKAGEAANSAKKVKDEADGVGQTTVKASIGIKELATSLGLVAIASAAFNTLKSSMDTAISRFDTLNTFPKVLQALGVSAEESEQAMTKLSDGIDGLPTTLNDIAANAQRMYTSFNDMDEAADTAVALNNAMLGSGASAADAQRGTEQYLQVLQKGKFEMDEWKTLQETMDVGLLKIAEGFEFAGKSAKNDLYNALQDGSITVDEFNQKLIELGTGTGIMADLAKENSLGLATSIGNLKNAAARGIADIIGSFNNLSQAVTGKDIAENIDSLKHVVNASFKTIGSVIEGTAPIIVLFADGVKATIPVVNALTPAIIGLMVAYGTYAIISKATTAIQASNAVLSAAQASQKALTLTILASTTATASQTGAITASNLVIGILTGRITLATAATIAKTVATYAWGAALRFLSGPVGWIVTGIGLLVTGVVALVKWFNKSSAEADRLNAETEELGESVNSLTKSVSSNANAYKESISSIESTSKANADLVQRIQELSEKENKSAADKLLLKDSIEQLNGSVDGLNLSYSEEANALNMSSEQLDARLKLMEDMETAAAGQERLLEISKEQNEVDMKLAEINELRADAKEKMENLDIKSKDYAETLAELQEQEDALKISEEELREQYGLTEAQITTAMENIATSTEGSVAIQLMAFASLNDANKELVEDMMSKWQEYKDAATDMFDTISDKVTITASEMASNMEENQRVIGEWADNIATLAERGIDEGLLNTLREAGPESAGHVNALVNASDEELQRLSTAFAEGGNVATDALSKSLGVEDSSVIEAVGNLVSDTEKSLKEQMEATDFESIGVALPEGVAKGTEKGTPKAEKASQEMAKKTADSFKSEAGIQSPSTVFKQFGLDLTDGLVLGIDGGASKVVQAIQKMFQSVQDDSKRSFDNIVKDHDTAVKDIEKTLNKLPEVAQKAMKDMLDRLKSGTAPQVQVMKTLAKDLLSPFDNTPKHFETIGKEAMAGFNSGLNAGKAQVLATATSIANQAAQTMRKALDIHSPSRVTRKIGNETGEGLKLGIKDKQKDVNATSEKMAKSVSAIIKSMNDSIKIDTTKHNAEIATIERRAKEDINAINAKAAKDKRKLTEAEIIRVRRINEDASKKIVSIEEKMAKEREKIAADSSKNLIAIAEKYVKDKTYAGEMSLKEEGHFWNQMYRTVEYGSDEYEKALQNHQNVVKKMRSEMESTNENYAKRITEIDKKLIEDTKKANDEYTQAYTKRLNDLLNVAGLFDEFAESEGITGYQLINNLQTQVDALEEYSHVINSLELKVDNAELFAELEALGPKALAELRALNSMSSDELQKYTSLYEERFKSAREQTIKELEPLKNNVTEQIKNLNDASQKELDVVQKEWTQAIENIVLGTEKEFDSMHQVGIDAVKGLEDGMISMESSLMDTARRIANAVRSTIQSALDINSPSRVMRDEVGRWIPEGIAMGIRENAKSVYSELENMADKMIMPASPEMALGSSRMALNGGLSEISKNISTSTDNRKSYNPTFHNYFTKEESSPSEVTRKNKQQSQKQALEWGFA